MNKMRQTPTEPIFTAERDALTAIHNATMGVAILMAALVVEQDDATPEDDAVLLGLITRAAKDAQRTSNN